MRKNIIGLSICIVCLVLLMTSCYRPGTLGATGYYEVYELGKIVIPVFANLSDDASRFDKVTLIETDDYGRSLYLYSCVGYCAYLVILQKCDKNTIYDFKIYWYDDCWRCKDDNKDDNAGGFSAEEKEALKDSNDWGKPLDTSKMNMAQIYRWSSSLSKEERRRYKAYAEALQARNEAAESAACALYGEGTIIRCLVGKNGLYYTLAHLPDGSKRFICFDPIVAKTIVRDKEYLGTDGACHDEFMSFMNTDN